MTGVENERMRELQALRVRRRNKARGVYNRSPHETLASPLLPPWMTPSSLETASPLGISVSNFTAPDVRQKRKVESREYPSSIGSLGSNY